MFVVGDHMGQKTIFKLTSRHSKRDIHIRKGPAIKITLHNGNISKVKQEPTFISEADKHQINIKEILLNTNATPIRSRTGVGYACCFCTNQFPEPAELKRHTIEIHNDLDKSNFMKGKDMHSYFVKLDITDLTCKLCGQGLENTEKLIDHLQITHNKTLFTDIKDHIIPFKFSSDVLSCFMCMNFFNTFKALQEHMNVHYMNFICGVCGAGFVNKNVLYRHGVAHKKGVFKCEQCSKTFDTARKKVLHDRAYHTEKRLPHKCGYCLERFKEVVKKYEHLSKIHGVNNPKVTCQACDKVFETKHAWRLHTTRVHLMLRPHQCDLCDMKFYEKRELLSHIVKHTGTREFKCDICFKTYGRKKTLKDHVKRLHK